MEAQGKLLDNLGYGHLQTVLFFMQLIDGLAVIFFTLYHEWLSYEISLVDIIGCFWGVNIIFYAIFACILDTKKSNNLEEFRFRDEIFFFLTLVNSIAALLLFTEMAVHLLKTKPLLIASTINSNLMDPGVVLTNLGLCFTNTVTMIFSFILRWWFYRHYQVIQRNQMDSFQKVIIECNNDD